MALLSLGRMVVDWVEYSQFAGPVVDAPTRSFDGIVWQEDDGSIEIDYVFPGSPADEAGLEAGDTFYMLEFQQYFTSDDLQRAIEGIPPAETRTYHIQRNGQLAEAAVTFTRYPTFLYPLSPALWQFAVWGFALGLFLHILGLIITAPLARRSKPARFSLVLIAASAVWFLSNSARLVMVNSAGVPPPDGTYAVVFQSLTFTGLAGWIAFPALLFHKVVNDAHRALRLRAGPLRFLIYLPALLLGAAATMALLLGSVGPFTMGSLVAPILFYACCYIAAAAALVILFHIGGMREKGELPGGWNREGSVALFVVALFLALSVQGAVPLFGAVTDVAAGWVIVSAQLLSMVPVVLVTLATLRTGKMSEVLSRGLTYVTTLGLIFFSFVGGMTVLDAYVEHESVAHNAISGVYVVLLLVLFERLARYARIYASNFFATERQQIRQALSRFQEQMRTILDHESLAQQTIDVVGQAFQAQSARLFVHPKSQPDRWISGAYHPQPPYLTERVIERVWPYFKREGRIWAQNAELNESSLPEGRARLLRQHGGALAIPIMGDGEPIGIMVLGPKNHGRSVWNLSDVDMLRSLSGQLALAVERLDLVSREKELVRESAEAELVALRSQINPHFLFNALNTIMALISERPERAEETVDHLASIFRHILKAGSEPYIPLKEEFALIDHYLRIEHARFGNRLQTSLDLPEELRDFPVPAFAVQTLVENAVKHGIGRKRSGGAVRIEAVADTNGGAEIRVTDDGVGIPELFSPNGNTDAASFYGIGLRNVASRLEQLYKEKDLLKIGSDPKRGTQASIALPSRVPDVKHESAGSAPLSHIS